MSSLLRTIRRRMLFRIIGLEGKITGGGTKRVRAFSQIFVKFVTYKKWKYETKQKKHITNSYSFILHSFVDSWFKIRKASFYWFLRRTLDFIIQTSLLFLAQATLIVLTQTLNKLSNRYSEITLKVCLHVCLHMHVTGDTLYNARNATGFWVTNVAS